MRDNITETVTDRMKAYRTDTKPFELPVTKRHIQSRFSLERVK